MTLAHPFPMPEFMSSSLPGNHNTFILSRHSPTKLNFIRPPNPKQKFNNLVSQKVKATGFFGSHLCHSNSRFNSCQLIDECYCAQPLTIGPSCRKHKTFSVKRAKTRALNDSQPFSMDSGFYSSRPRSSGSKILSGGALRIPNNKSFKHSNGISGAHEANWSNQKLVLRCKSVLSVDKAVEREGSGGGLSMENSYDAIVIGSGIGGLVAATQLAVKGARVLVLEKYVIPGGSSGYYQRDGYTFDVGSSVMFGFSAKVSFLRGFLVSFPRCTLLV